jgi:hypothetical protein
LAVFSREANAKSILPQQSEESGSGNKLFKSALAFVDRFEERRRQSAGRLVAQGRPNNQQQNAYAGPDETDLASLSFDSFQFRFGLKETDLEPKKQTNRPANNKGNT